MSTGPGLKKGDRVRVIAGASAGKDGVVESVDEVEFLARVRIDGRFTIKGEPLVVSLAFESLEPAGESPGPGPPPHQPATLDTHGRPCNGCFGHGRVTLVSVRDRETGLWDQPFELRSPRYYHESDEVRRGFRACPDCDGTGSGPTPGGQS